MVVEPKIVSNVCLNAHPKGCKAEVARQIQYIQSLPHIPGAKNVLILGCSAGYGLATRIALTYASDATTLGISIEREASATKTGSVGYYNNMAFSALAREHGKKEHTLNLDAFATESKTIAIQAARQLFGTDKIDLIIYSLASPMRKDPVSGEVYKSVLKPISSDFSGMTIDLLQSKLSDITVEKATQAEIDATIKVMGGTDWALWIDALAQADLLAAGVLTLAYSYVGPEMTYPIYRDGTIGLAKNDLELTAQHITQQLKTLGGHAYVSINKAVVTRASCVIPVVPLYLAILFKVMSDKGLHEGCIEQAYRLLQQLYHQDNNIHTDALGRLRLDDYEMQEDVQAAVTQLWSQIDEHNVQYLTSIDKVRQEFMRLHGFEVEGIDYQADIDITLI
jgi:enoyl-[acyl-carrier protein] reductase/trans-2-enoyl-CoA reductase (NAD+)